MAAIKRSKVRSICEWLRSNEVRRLWEIEVNEKGSKEKDRVKTSDVSAKNNEQMLKEFKIRNVLKDKDKYYADVESNTLEYFQVIETLAPYLTVASLKEINHDMSTPLNESLNKAMTAVASKDRSYNSSTSLEGRQAVVELRRNVGPGNYLEHLCQGFNVYFNDGLRWLS